MSARRRRFRSQSRKGYHPMTDAFVAPAGVVRLTENWPSNSINAPVAGSLILIDNRGEASSRMDTGGMRIHTSKLRYEAHPPLTWRDFDQLLAFYLSGHAYMPNCQTIDTEEALERIACGGGLTAPYGVSHARLPHHKREGWPGWARVFVSHTQGGAFDGRGYAIAYRGASARENFRRIYTFALCAHDVKPGRGARPTRGWHPAHCTRCGLDMSVDSGD